MGSRFEVEEEEAVEEPDPSRGSAANCRCMRLLAEAAAAAFTRRTSDSCESSWVMGSIGSRWMAAAEEAAEVAVSEPPPTEEAPGGLRNCDRRLRLFSPRGWCLERILTM